MFAQIVGGHRASSGDAYDQQPKEAQVAIPNSLMRRLTIARYLFQMGVEQSHRGEPFAALAISPLHDAAELFLQAGLEHCQGALAGNKDFLSYWPAIEQKGKKLSRYEQMRRFNRARVALKHDGTLQAQSEIEDFRRIVESFFEENSPTLFGLEFSEISLSGLVKNELVRTSLQLAEKAIRDGDCKRAIEEAAKAFRRALSEYHGHPVEHTLKYLYDPAAIFSSSLWRFRSYIQGDTTTSQLRDALEAIVNALSDAITVVAYNLDFDGFRYLKGYGPVVHESPGGNIVVEWPITMVEPPINVEIASRCVDFAINAALRLQSKTHHTPSSAA
jgi:hypothetical protein